jgi:hypothetical protein
MQEIILMLKLWTANRSINVVFVSRVGACALLCVRKGQGLNILLCGDNFKSEEQNLAN